MNFKLLTVTLAAVFVAFRLENCCAQFFPNLFNNNNGNNPFQSLFPAVNNQNGRPASNWPYISNPSQQQQNQQNFNDQTGNKGQSPNNQQPWQQQQSYNQPQQNQQPFGGDGKEDNNNYFGNNPFLNFGFPSWFGNGNKRPYQNSNNQPQPSYQQQQQQPSGTPDYNSGQQQQQQPHQTQNQQPSHQQQQQPVGNPEYSGGKQQPGILPSSYQQNPSHSPNQSGHQGSNQPGHQNQNQQGYQSQNQPGYQNQNGGYQNPQYVPQQEAPLPPQQQQRPQQQPFDDGQYRPDKYGGGGGFKPSYNPSPSQGNIYAPTQHQPHERDLVGDLRINGSDNGSQLDLEQGPPLPVPANNESGQEAQPNWVYPDD